MLKYVYFSYTGSDIMKILVLNGPNINMTGTREKDIYGSKSYDELCGIIKSFAAEKGITADIHQSNLEGEIINLIQGAGSSGGAAGRYDGIIINPGAYSHYSIAIYDALLSVNIPSIEVHLSNIYKREEFRHKSVTAPACIGVVSGFGIYGYIMAVMAFMQGGI